MAETKYHMGALGLCFLMLAGAVEPPEPAQSPVHVAIEGNLPFSAAELETALLARLPPDVPAGTLSLSMRPDGMVEVSWQTMKRAIDISEDSGGTAARVVALLAADLFVPLHPPSIAPPDADVAAARTSTTSPAKAIHVAAGYEVSTGGGQNSLLHGPTLGAGLNGRILRLRTSAGWESSTPNNLVAMTAWPLRIGAGAGTSYLSLVGSFVMVPYHLQGVVDVTRVLTGAAAEVESRFALAAGFSLRALAGADFFLGTSLQVRAGGVTLFKTAAVALRFGVALAWEIPR